MNSITTRLSVRASAAVRKAQAVLGAREVLRSAQTSASRARSYLSTEALQDWATDLATGDQPRAELVRRFGDALHTAVRYQDAVLASGVDSDETLAQTDAIDRAIGSGTPFTCLVAMIEVAKHFDPELGTELGADAYAVAKWPLLAALNRVFPDGHG